MLAKEIEQEVDVDQSDVSQVWQHMAVVDFELVVHPECLKEIANELSLEYFITSLLLQDIAKVNKG